MSHYFETPTGPVSTRRITVRIWGREHTFTTAGGVFSGSRLDLGTSVLFRSVPAPSGPGTFLDLGCGYGPISCALALACPDSRVVGVDVNDLAVDLTARNALDLGVADRVRACRPEQVPADLRFDEIWSNPPIRVGKEILHEMLLHWLDRLGPDGVAHLVVGRNLGADSLARWLEANHWQVARVASAKGYRVLDVTR
ncbi:Ribosomal RNA small subunit methyltransferase C [Acidipropionibacterium jensenii]|uniref:Methyltransferase domain-containing protein n=1 Tax=Acidipropionibacterium jensenii TaxID=1749 RepID=A0A3Q9UQG5_9ACTN|nr:methyltransferase [Acidipropionibacterium jensenii]AZZ38932.1 methyltransferase domain-containing protein [Acidipropionibacterium jensenii]AZZ42699.1 methyltransferase domain-containing protein [Acidipropionibacterium jensenii]MDN6440655.1 methyltransferase [Acidipropionibacterium jensenii]QCV88334.1 methyltransferase [Acidipropionibacterium jensenii]VEI04065.1 Ribosomal RNA small subunit methyltransferase C [Acidipropionibacterium jensenii]